MRSQVLAQYRRIFREAARWENVGEREGIREEARSLFRKNRNLPEEDVKERLDEADARIELALHYRIASPRLQYAQKGTEEHDPDSLRRNWKGESYLKSHHDDMW